MFKSLKSRSTSTSSIFQPHSTASDIHSFSMRQRKRRTSEKTLKHKRVCQLDVCYTLFPNVEHFHTLIHRSHANSWFISHSDMSGSRNVSASSSQTNLTLLRISTFTGKISIKRPFETGQISREFVIRTPCLCELQ